MIQLLKKTMSSDVDAPAHNNSIYKEILTQLSDTVTTNATVASDASKKPKEASKPEHTSLLHQSESEKEAKHEKKHKKKHDHGHALASHGHKHGHGHGHGHDKGHGHSHSSRKHRKHRKHSGHHKKEKKNAEDKKTEEAKKPHEKKVVTDIDIDLIKSKKEEQPKPATIS